MATSELAPRIAVTVRLTSEAIASLDAEAKKRKISRTKMMEALALYGDIPKSIKIV